MAGIYGNKTRVQVDLGDVKCFFFYSMACADELREHFGNPEKAHNAFYKAILHTNENGSFKIDESKSLIGKTDAEIFADPGFYQTLRIFIRAMTLTWSVENKCEPVDFFHISEDYAGECIRGIARAFGLAMPKPDENADKKDPQEP